MGGIGSHALRYLDKKDDEDGVSYNRTSNSTTKSPILFLNNLSNSCKTKGLKSINAVELLNKRHLRQGLNVGDCLECVH